MPAARIDGSEPKYKFPAGFKKSQVLYNLDRVLKTAWPEELAGLVIVVEGFFGCMKVHQAGYPCVALMGCSLSPWKQEGLLVWNFSDVILLLDGDNAGRGATGEIATRLASKLWVRSIELPEGAQPDQMEEEETDIGEIIAMVL